jgi:hypothetical protein
MVKWCVVNRLVNRDALHGSVKTLGSRYAYLGLRGWANINPKGRVPAGLKKAVIKGFQFAQISLLSVLDSLESATREFIDM